MNFGLCMDLLGYNNKNVVVTGCASGIGLATTILLTELGARVTGVDRHQPERTAGQFVQADFLQRDSIDAALQKLPDSVDALFNCAGLGPSLADELVLQVNLFGTRYFTESVIPRMGPGSAIASIASIGGAGWPDHVSALLEFLELQDTDEALNWYQHHKHLAPNAYSFSKEALVVWTKRRAPDLIRQGIRINCTSPGTTRTPMLDVIEGNIGAKGVDVASQPMGRCSTPEEQAWALVMLNSARAACINGVDLAVDGGSAAMRTIKAAQ